jgi:DNA replication initiation complex subunit (GINS family)
MEDISYESLWQVVYKEKKSNELQAVPKTFYDDILKYIERQENQQNGEANETKQNAERLLNDLFERRKQKILIYIAHNKSLPQPTIPAEQKFYELVLDDYKKTTLDGYKKEDRPGKTNLYINKDIPEILLPSGSKIGPHKAGDKIEVSDDEDVEFLKSTQTCISKTE